MRQVKFLIAEAKQNTNTVDNEAISDELCCRLLNRAQSYIQAYLFNQNVSSRLLRTTSTFDFQSGIDTYELPFNIYATNSVINVQQKVTSGLYTSYFNVKRVTDKNRGDMYGYILADKNIIFTPVPQQGLNIVITYTKKAPALSVPYGTISSVSAGTISLGVGYKDLSLVDDYFCIIGTDGEIFKRKLPALQVADVITVADTTGILPGMIVVPGDFTVTRSILPDEFEAPLVMALETLINARISSSDIPVSKAFSDAQLDQIGSMYAEDASDTVMPPVVEFREWV